MSEDPKLIGSESRPVRRRSLTRRVSRSRSLRERDNKPSSSVDLVEGKATKSSHSRLRKASIRNRDHLGKLSSSSHNSTANNTKNSQGEARISRTHSSKGRLLASQPARRPSKERSILSPTLRRRSRDRLEKSSHHSAKDTEANATRRRSSRDRIDSALISSQHGSTTASPVLHGRKEVFQKLPRNSVHKEGLIIQQRRRRISESSNVKNALIQERLNDSRSQTKDTTIRTQSRSNSREKLKERRDSMSSTSNSSDSSAESFFSNDKGEGESSERKSPTRSHSLNGRRETSNFGSRQVDRTLESGLQKGSHRRQTLSRSKSMTYATLGKTRERLNVGTQRFGAPKRSRSQELRFRRRSLELRHSLSKDQNSQYLGGKSFPSLRDHFVLAGKDGVGNQASSNGLGQGSQDKDSEDHSASFQSLIPPSLTSDMDSTATKDMATTENGEALQLFVGRTEIGNSQGHHFVKPVGVNPTMPLDSGDLMEVVEVIPLKGSNTDDQELEEKGDKESEERGSVSRTLSFSKFLKQRSFTRKE